MPIFWSSLKVKWVPQLRSSQFSSWVWCWVPLTSTLRRLTWESHEFKTYLGYGIRSCLNTSPEREVPWDQHTQCITASMEINRRPCLKKREQRTGELEKWWRASSALLEDPRHVPSTHIRPEICSQHPKRGSSQVSVTPAPEDPTPLASLSACSHVHMPTRRHLSPSG